MSLRVFVNGAPEEIFQREFPESYKLFNQEEMKKISTCTLRKENGAYVTQIHISGDAKDDYTALVALSYAMLASGIPTAVFEGAEGVSRSDLSKVEDEFGLSFRVNST